MKLGYINKIEIDRLSSLFDDSNDKLTCVSICSKINTLMEIKEAGSGHLGSSFSALDILIYLYFEHLNTVKIGIDSSNRDIFFSSKGHDVPGHYAVLMAAGILAEEKIRKLRKLNGLDGHPDIKIPGIEFCTGSLGMGISKAKGMKKAKDLKQNLGKVYVMLGDGELQEGQIWESAQVASHHKTKITAIVDNNKLQTDMPVSEIIQIEELEQKFKAFNWNVIKSNGHDFNKLRENFRKADDFSGPTVIICDTVKGKGISFMEKVSDTKTEKGKYIWHSGAPSDDYFLKGYKELLDSLNRLLEKLKKTTTIKINEPKGFELGKISSKGEKEILSKIYGSELCIIAEKNQNIVVLDGDLSADCQIREFEKTYPNRFIENGIAEQDMVSTAGGLAAAGLLPIVNSFGSFLCSRANEQIYNNACEGTKIIYAAHFAGLLPAGPGKSHQCLRDISLFSSMPNTLIFQPTNAEELKQILNYSINCKENILLRLNIGPSPKKIEFLQNSQFLLGHGKTIKDGNDILGISYGPVMTNELLGAHDLLKKKNISLKVVVSPCLNHFDSIYYEKLINEFEKVVIVEDHHNIGGFGDLMVSSLTQQGTLKNKKLQIYGVDGMPACGTPREVLNFHQLSSERLAERIGKFLTNEKIVINEISQEFDNLSSPQ